MTQERQEIRNAEILGRIYGKLRTVTEEDAERAASGNAFREVLLAYWTETARDPSLCRELSGLISRCGSGFPELLEDAERQAFIRGCLGQPENRIARYRKRAGLSQKELAETAGVKQSQISRWESGNMPSLPNLDRLSSALGCSIDELLHGKEGTKDD